MMEQVFVTLIEAAPISISVIALFYLLFRRFMQSADAQSKGVQTQTTALIETVAQGQKTIQIISSALDNNTKAVEALTGQLSIQNAEMIAIRTLLIAEIRQTKEEAVEEIVERITEIVEAKNDISSYESGSGSDVSSV